MNNSSSEISFPLDNFDYRLLDTGNGKKLERFGPFTFIRPAAQAIWAPLLPAEEWDKAHGEFTHHKGQPAGGGEWEYFSKVPMDGWSLKFRELVFEVKPTRFGHLGMFPEQAINWPWIMEQIQSHQGSEVRVLNIFGYTGGSTLAAAWAGAQVTHLDASKTSVTWARKNLELSGLAERPVRWIVDDVTKFLTREQRRGKKYDALIIDPPSFGRGPKGELWKIETHLAELMKLCKSVLSDKPLFVVLTTHSPGVSGLTLKNLILEYLIPANAGEAQMGDMYLHDATSGRHLPNGFFARVRSGR